MVKTLSIFLLLCSLCYGSLNVTNQVPGSRRSQWWLQYNTNNVSFSFWVYPVRLPGTGYNRVFIRGGGIAYQYCFSTSANNSEWSFGWYDSNWNGLNFPQSFVPSNEWTHVCCVYDHPNGYAAVYINGVEATNKPTIGGIRASSTWFDLGPAAPTLYSVIGYFHDFRYYERALSANEAYWLYSHPYGIGLDSVLILRNDISLEDTGTTLTGVARNFGRGGAGTFYSNPVVATRHHQIRKPLGMHLP